MMSRHPLILAALAAIAIATQSASAQSYTTLLNNGPSANRIDIVFVGDGYTSSDLAAGTYFNHVNTQLSYLFTPGALVDPFPRYSKFFNAHAVSVASLESGCDVPQNGIFRNTALDATYRYDGVTDRLLYFNDSKANTAMTAGLAGSGITADMKFGTVNNSIYGGGGGNWAVYAGANSSAREIALHEVAHSFSGLADEYGGFATPYNGPEPSEPNVTTDPSGAKWSRWNGYVQPGIGTIGAYQGGRYYDTGIYRPSNSSKMRVLGAAFDAVSREKIVLDIYSKVRPLDSYTPNSATLNSPSSVSVVSIDDNVIDYQWFVDDTLILDQTDSTFNFGSYADGLHTLKVRAYDPTGFDPVNGWVRMNQNLLEEFVTWNFVTAVPEPGSVALFAAGLLVVCRVQRTPRCRIAGLRH